MKHLTQKQQAAVDVLVEGKSQREAASRAGVDLDTIKTWLTESEFVSACAVARRRVVNASVSSLLDELNHPGRRVRPSHPAPPPPPPAPKILAGPYGEAVDQLSMAGTSHAVVSITLSFACRAWERAAFLVRKRNELVAVGASGREVDAATCGSVLLWKESMFMEALTSLRVFHGELSRIEPHAAFVHGLSPMLKWPEESLIYPLSITGRAVGVLYADRRIKNGGMIDMGELTRLCEIAAVRLADILAAKKGQI